jgi:glycosyltransferase involved in cell wall biosynthesis
MAAAAREGWSSLSRLKILTVGHSYVVALNRALVRKVAQDAEFEITVAAPSYFRGDLRPIVLEPEPPGSPLRVVPLDTKFSRFVHIFSYDGRALEALIRDGHFDVVHAWEEPYVFAGYQIARALKNSSARFCFRTAQSYVKHYPPPFGHFERVVMGRAQGWIAGATLVYDAMLKRGFPQSKGRTLNLAVDLAEFQPVSPAARAGVLEELGLQPPVVGFVGRLTEAKGLDVLMEAMDKVGGARSWSLLLLGSGEYKKKVEAWAVRNGWKNRVKVLLVKHGEMPRYLGSMDLLAAPSQTMKNWREQFGRMIIEAFACGVPVIGSDSGEIPFVIGDAGRVVAERDVAGWAQAIGELLDSPQKRDELRAAGLARAPRYSTATIARQYGDFYRWLAQQSPRLSPSGAPQAAIQ